MFIFSQFIPRFIPKYILFATPGLYILFAYLFSVLPINKIAKYSLIIIILAYSIIKVNSYKYNKEDCNKAAHYIIENKNEKTLVIVQAWYTFKPFTYYYSKDIFKEDSAV